MRGGVDDKGKKLPELIDSYEDFSSDTRVKFVVKLKPAQMKNARDQGIHEYLGKLFFLPSFPQNQEYKLSRGRYMNPWFFHNKLFSSL